jgi:hypothetical protein
MLGDHMREFHYFDGNVVQVGDHVRTAGGRLGTVEEILQPGTAEAQQFLCSDGGVLIIEDWEGVKSPLVMQPPDGKYWEDIELIERVWDGGIAP